MINYSFEGKTVTDYVFEANGDGWCDGYVEAAWFADGTPLSPDELSRFDAEWLPEIREREL